MLHGCVCVQKEDTRKAIRSTEWRGQHRGMNRVLFHVCSRLGSSCVCFRRNRSPLAITSEEWRLITQEWHSEKRPFSHSLLRLGATCRRRQSRTRHLLDLTTSDAEKLISSHYKMARLWAGYEEMCSASIKWKIGGKKRKKITSPLSRAKTT